MPATVPLKAEPIGSSGSNVLNKPVGGVAPDASYLIVESRVYRIDAVVRLLDPFLVLVAFWDVRFVACASVLPDPPKPFFAVARESRVEHSERSEVRVWYTRSYAIDPTSDKFRVQAPPRKEESARLVSIDYCPMVDAAEE